MKSKAIDHSQLCCLNGHLALLNGAVPGAGRRVRGADGVKA
jgi:hypothetical protein